MIILSDNNKNYNYQQQEQLQNNCKQIRYIYLEDEQPSAATKNVKKKNTLKAPEAKRKNDNHINNFIMEF